MHRDRVEEVTLIGIALGLLCFLLPFSLPRALVISVVLALLLITILILRSLDWHQDHATPFDGVLVIGVVLTVIYLFSFSALSRSVVGFVLLIAFAAYYILLAVALWRHRWLFSESTVVSTRQRQTTARPRTGSSSSRLSSSSDHLEGDASRDGVSRADVQHHVADEPRKRTLFHRVFRRNMEPIPEMVPPRVGKAHSHSFKKGIEPIHDITEEHLHKLGVYDIEDKSAKSSRGKQPI